MPVLKSSSLPIRSDADVVQVRQAVRNLAVELKFGLVDQTKVVTAASELARNTLDHGGGGGVTIEVIAEGAKQGLRMTFEDTGPGIRDIEQAMRDGYTSGKGMGLGLGGAKRLTHEFAVESEFGKGTKVTITRWK
ncbi:MAG: anti-sigma regulatory factor [Rhodospirillales bacterium]|nr:anti-sigma regulatory factor [Rhodospirillales bacterium]